MFINKNESPIPNLASTGYEKLALSICFAGIVMIGFVSAIYDYVLSVVGG
jgi:hypothetical protein